MKLKRIIAAAACVPLLVGVAACGGGDDSTDTASTASAATGSEQTSSAPATTQPQDTKSTSDKSSTDKKSTQDKKSSDSKSSESPDSGKSDASGEDVDPKEFVKMLKAATKDKMSMHLTANFKGSGQQMTMEGDASIAGKDTAMDITIKSPATGNMHMLVVDQVLYMSMPGKTPKGKFLKIDTTDSSNPMGQNFEGLIDSMDPTSSYDAFDAGLKKVQLIGKEKIDGESMRHYRLKVDAKAAAKAQGQTPSAKMPKTLTYDMWLDSQDRMRKMEFKILGAQVSMTADNWGEKVNVQAPPPSKIMEMPSR